MISLILLRTTSKCASISVLFISYTLGSVNNATYAAIPSEFIIINTNHHLDLRHPLGILTQDDQGHSVEPSAHVRETPQHQAELDGVDEVLHQEQAAQLSQYGIDMGNGNARHLLNLLLRQLKFKVQEGPGTENKGKDLIKLASLRFSLLT